MKFKNKLLFVLGRSALLPEHNVELLLHSDDVLLTIREILAANPIAESAIIVSSPSLHAAISGDSPSEEALRSAAAMLLRMASRATPLGLFAGCGWVTLSETGSNSKQAPLELKDIIVEISSAEIIPNEHDPQDRLTLSGDCYLTKSRLRATLTLDQIDDTSKPQYRRTALRRSGAVTSIFDLLTRAELTRAELRRAFLSEGLYESTFDRTLEAMMKIGAVKRVEVDAPVVSAIESLKPREKYIGRVPTFDSLKRLQQSNAELIANAALTYDGGLSQEVMATVSLVALAAKANGAQVLAASYRQAFENRFEGSSRLAPLSQFIDLCEELGLEAPMDSKQARSDAASQMLTLRLAEAHHRGSVEVILSDADFTTLIDGASLITEPRSFEIGVRFIRRSENELWCTHAHFTGSAAAGASGARFTNLIEPLNVSLRELNTKASDVNEVEAEIFYEPSIVGHRGIVRRGLTGNRTLDIGLPRRKSSLDFSQLYVTVSNNRLRLFSKETNEWIIPTESHPYLTGYFGPPVARLLRAIGLDGRVAVSRFQWPGPTVPFTPRLRYHSAVIDRARWVTSVSGIKSDAEIEKAVNYLRGEWGMPSNVVLISGGDNAIPVDVSRKLGWAIVRRAAKKQSMIVFEEVLGDYADSLVRSKAGSHASEFLFSFSGLSASRETEAPLIVDPRPMATAWRYLRWFASPTEFDRLTRDARSTVRSSQADVEWHCVRYWLPRAHLRVRFREDDTEHSLVPEFQGLTEKLLTDGIISSFDWSLYEPEFERYGGVTSMRVVEQLFTESSEQAADSYSNLRNGQSRIRCAVETFCFSILITLPREDLISWSSQLTNPRRKLDGATHAWIFGLARAPMRDSELTSQLRLRLRRKFSSTLNDLAHMHFNRFGIHGTNESEAFAVLRQIAVVRANVFLGRPGSR